MPPFGADWFRRPELILADMIRRHAVSDARERHYRRAVVVAVDLEGGQLQNEDGSGSMTVTDRSGRVRSYPALAGVRNPRGSVKARILTDGLDRLLADDDLRVFWPLLPQDQLAIPISPGEHVYVVFEDEGMSNGLWISRVPGQESANSFAGVDSYDAPSSPPSAMDFFEENDVGYIRTDEHAGLAPPVDPLSFFEE